MPRFVPASLRGRLLLLVALALFPAFGLTVFTGLERRQHDLDRARTDVVRLVSLASADQERLVGSTQQLLDLLRALPEVRAGDSDACSKFFAGLLTRYPVYTNFGVIGLDGRVRCSGVPGGAGLDLSDRAYFRQALATRAFAIGEHQIGRITGKAELNFGLPVIDSAGAVTGVVFATLDLSWFNQYAARAQLPAGATLILIDRGDLVLARYPADTDWIGRSVGDASLIRAVRAAAPGEVLTVAGLDGRTRLYSFARLAAVSTVGDLDLIVGIPTEVAYADADQALRRDLAALLILLAGALAATWLAGERFIRRPVLALLRATRRLSAGDLRIRTGLPPGPGELEQLALAFDEMAAALERAEAERRIQEELRRQNFELEQQNRAIQESDRLKSEFVSMASHELRTPLTAILGYVDLLLDGVIGPISDDQIECLDIVKRSAHRLLKLINDLLDLARIEAGKVELQRDSVDLGNLVAEVVGALRPLIEAKGQLLVVDLGSDLPAAWADPDRAAQILTNLLSNAHKYTPAGGTLRIVARRVGDQARIDVQDTGIGLSEAEQARLFTKFFRSANSIAQEAGGTGLGLTITRSLVELHGGQLAVSSRPGAGSTFSFTLPLSAEAPAAPPASLAPVGAWTPGGRILVVDDEPDIANLIRRYLTGAGYEVDLASDGEAALRLARANRPDLVTLDVILPGADGFTVLEWLKQDPATASIPVVMLSVLTDEGRGKMLGAVDYLAKPAGEAVLLERVAGVLGSRRSRRILVADDEAEVRSLVAGQLERAGHKVFLAADGFEALEMIRRERPGLVLLDIRMPRLDGIATLREMREDPSTRDLPVIMMTASPDILVESRSTVEALGGADLLGKPITAEELARAISEGLRGRHPI